MKNWNLLSADKNFSKINLTSYEFFDMGKRCKIAKKSVCDMQTDFFASFQIYIAILVCCAKTP